MTCCSKCNRFKDHICTCDEDSKEELTLRDKFALAVLKGTYANPALDAQGYEDGIAEGAYRQADAMLKAREYKPETEGEIL